MSAYNITRSYDKNDKNSFHLPRNIFCYTIAAAMKQASIYLFFVKATILPDWFVLAIALYISCNVIEEFLY